MTYIFLDHNSTTSIKPFIKDAMFDVMEHPLNASSIHNFGRKAKEIVNLSRKKILDNLNAEGEEVIFTSSGTEANNLAVKGFFNVDYIAISTIEHISVVKSAFSTDKEIIEIPVDNNGVIDIDCVEKIAEEYKDRVLFSIMLANNETGVIQPIKEIGEIIHKYNGYLHCDAIQALGKISVDFSDLNVDMLTISSHKIGGPQGAAALVIDKSLLLEPMIYGGSQENNNRAGTENIPSILGFGMAVDSINNEVKSNGLIGYLESNINGYIDHGDDIEIFGKNADRVYNTTFIAMKGMDSQTQVINFDLAGIAVSNGSACSSGTVKKSHVLKAMNVSDEVSSCAVRVSIGEETTKSDIDRFFEVWKNNYEKVKNRKQYA